jgi:hypothetical protein
VELGYATPFHPAATLEGWGRIFFFPQLLTALGKQTLDGANIANNVLDS